MAVSGSTDFKLNAEQIVEEARSLLGIHADEEPMAAHELTKGLRAANMMLKEWQAEGVMISTYTEGTLTLVEGQESYTFQSGGDFTTVPFEIVQMRITRNSTDLEMIEMSRDDYFALPIKTNKGYPTQWYYDRQRDTGKLYVWPSPDSTAGTLKFTYRRIINDLDANADDLDLPQEWYQAVVYGLAKKLMPRYGKTGTPDGQFVAAEAGRSYAVVKGFDIGTGKGSIEILPSMGR